MIRIENLSIRYGDLTAIRELSLEIPKNEIMAIVGPSGSGKSSLLSAMNRLTDLIPEAKVTGQIQIDELDILSKRMDPVSLRRDVGMIFQKPTPFPMSIRRNLQLAVKEHLTIDREELEQITETTLMQVGLWDEVKDRLNQSALKLSGGQKQRLCIARALALKPKVLLMDEPCSALDPIATSKIEELIDSLKRQYTIVIVTHNLAQARRLSHQLAVFWIQDQAGSLVEAGATQELFQNPQSPITASYLAGEIG